MVGNVVNRIHEISNNSTLRSILGKLRVPIFLACLVVLITRMKPALFFPALFVSLFGELIQVWSFASLDKNTELAVKGPYLLTRNPMYLGRFFLLLGFLLLTGRVWVIFLFMVVYYFYMVNRVKREEKKLLQVFGERYASYCREVNRFVPSLKNFQWKPVLFFRWNLLIENNGHWNLMAVVLCYALLYYFAFIH